MSSRSYKQEISKAANEGVKTGRGQGLGMGFFFFLIFCVYALGMWCVHRFFFCFVGVLVFVFFFVAGIPSLRVLQLVFVRQLFAAT
jgi:hypothetical protein